MDLCSECGAYWECQHRASQAPGPEDVMQERWERRRMDRLMSSAPIAADLLTEEGWNSAHEDEALAWELGDNGLWVRKDAGP